MENTAALNTQKKYHTLIFDLDGTISDSHPGITRSAQYALDHYGIHIEDLSQLKYFVGPPLDETFSRDFGFEGQRLQDIINKYREYFQTKGYTQQEPYAGALEMIKDLHASGATLAVATSKPTKFADIIVKGYGVRDCFKTFTGSTMDRSRIHKTDVLTYLISQLDNQDKSGMVMIGDREHDLMAAKACGIDAIGVLYGYGSREELDAHDPVYLADDIAGLREYLLAHI